MSKTKPPKSPAPPTPVPLVLGDTWAGSGITFRIDYERHQPNDNFYVLSYKEGDYWLSGQTPISEDSLQRMITRLGLHRSSPPAVIAHEHPKRVKRANGDLTKSEVAIALGRLGTATTTEIAKQVNKPTAATNSALAALVRRGYATAQRQDKGIVWTASKTLIQCEQQ